VNIVLLKIFFCLVTVGAPPGAQHDNVWFAGDDVGVAVDSVYRFMPAEYDHRDYESRDNKQTATFPFWSACFIFSVAIHQ
jgi:hypothetical protein